MEEVEEMLSSKGRRKKSFMSHLSCFTGQTHRRGASFDETATPISPKSSSGSPSNHDDLPEMKNKYRNVRSCMSRHRRHSSADFSYDPLSYALNFEDDPPMRTRFDIPRRKVLQDERVGVDRTGNNELRRGFEALTVSMSEVDQSGPEHKVNVQELTSPRAAAVAEVRRSLAIEE